jgi:hypothetical protein
VCGVRVNALCVQVECIVAVYTCRYVVVCGAASKTEFVALHNCCLCVSLFVVKSAQIITFTHNMPALCHTYYVIIGN